MNWTGQLTGIKGYQTYKFKSSNTIGACSPSARYSKEGLFSLVYRRKCDNKDKREITAGIRRILNFEGSYLTWTDYKAGTLTLEFYCRLPERPLIEQMQALENYFLNFPKK